MNNKLINIVAVFLSSIAIEHSNADTLNSKSSEKLIVNPSESILKMPLNYIDFLKKYNENSINKSKINIDNTVQEIIEMSKDSYFLNQASRIYSGLEILRSNAKLNNNKLDKDSETYLELKTDSLALQKYVQEKYKNAYDSFEKMSKDKEMVKNLKEILPYKLVTDSAVANTNVYANAEAIANAVAVSNVAAATNFFVAAEVCVVPAVFIV